MVAEEGIERVAEEGREGCGRKERIAEEVKMVAEERREES